MAHPGSSTAAYIEPCIKATLKICVPTAPRLPEIHFVSPPTGWDPWLVSISPTRRPWVALCEGSGIASKQKEFNLKQDPKLHGPSIESYPTNNKLSNDCALSAEQRTITRAGPTTLYKRAFA